MPKVRISVPADVADEVLFANRHRCCVCHEPRKPVHIHHIDENPENNDPGNLAVLCLDHHSDVTGNEGLGRNYSENEIRLFKESGRLNARHPGQTLMTNLILMTRKVSSRFIM